MSMSLDELASIAKQLGDQQRSEKELRLLLLTLQQAIADMLGQMSTQGTTMAAAVREGLSGLKLPTPEVSINMPPEEKEPKCSWVVSGLEYRKDGRLTGFKIDPVRQ